MFRFSLRSGEEHGHRLVTCTVVEAPGKGRCSRYGARFGRKSVGATRLLGGLAYRQGVAGRLDHHVASGDLQPYFDR